jgi:hypothetical protein
MADPAGSNRIQYEVANALGALWAIAPRLAAKLNRLHNYAKAVQTYLRAVDFYCLQNGVSPGRVRIDTTVHDDRIVQRISG